MDWFGSFFEPGAVKKFKSKTPAAKILAAGIGVPGEGRSD
jgi:hypothetical protein